VVQRKTPATDGYDAVQLGLMEYVKKVACQQAAAGHLKKSSAEGVKFMREFRLGEGANGDMKAGDRVLADEFKPKEKVDVIGISKGRGLCRRGQAPSFPRSAMRRTVRCSTGLPDPSERPAFPSRVFPVCAWAATWALIASRCAISKLSKWTSRTT
jgi:large subunit ribosomal protein L3